MATFEEHIAQARRNLDFLEQINLRCNNHWDWQVTACFYVAVHLANAHIAQKSNMHYRSHSDVKNALNPENSLSVMKFQEAEYIAYVKLMNLSRRARYLCHDVPSNLDGSKAYMTFDVHLKKAVKNLDKLLVFIQSEYNESFNKLDVKCIPLTEEMNYFKPIN